MHRRHLDPANNEELYGNNAAFCCPVCRRVFIVSGFIDKKGRPCPGCGRATGHVEKSAAFIEWQNETETHAAPSAHAHDRRYRWSELNIMQVGAYAEYFVKMEFAMHAFE